MSKENKQVLLGMSGGTDSSVAAMLLQEQGYEVTGVTFRFYEKDGENAHLEDAKELAKRLGIRHITYDAREIFKKNIIDYFINEYMDARTPVPCVVCNNLLKFPLLAAIADDNNIPMIATGHYVRTIEMDNHLHIRCAVDKDKDQSFFLWGLPQSILRRMLLPLGEITKENVRRYAAEKGFQKVSTKKDSIGVCFCPFDYRSFLRRYVDADNLKKGKFFDESGKFLGWHEGYPFYTIGQRRGLGIHLNKAVFVKDIDKEKNEVVLAPLNSLEKEEMFLKEWKVVNGNLLFGNDEVIVKIRYRKQANRCKVTVTSDGLFHVALLEPLTAIAPGQAAAFYKDDVVLGGGIII